VRLTPEGVRYKVIGSAEWSDEGATLPPTGICGSGIIEIVGELFMAGLIDSTGKFLSDAENRHPNIRRPERTAELVLSYAPEIVMTQKDIRAIQLAKAALYAGARLLMRRLGLSQIDQVRLAGAFGSYIDPRYAMQIGLIPDCDLAHVVSIGNAAGDGARIALLNRDQRQQIQTWVRQVEYVETAAEISFQDDFVEAMLLPHASDAFPHLDALKEEKK
jgi:uncharacterized 2Fe-2S/4Fe-4S cluster protein (DUF4445 family)